jgi:hypothetical protein
MNWDPSLLAPRGGNAAAQPVRAEVGGELVIRLADGLEVEKAESRNPDVAVRVRGDRGQMVHSV